MDERQEHILELLPLHPDDTFDTWAKRHKTMQDHVIVYKMVYVPDILSGEKQKMVHCHCSACDKVFYQAMSPAVGVRSTVSFGWYDDNNDPVGNEDACSCPCCGAKAISLHSSKIPKGGRTIGYYFPIQIMKLGGVPVLICWRYRRTVEKNGGTWISAERYEAYAFCEKKAFRYCGYYNFMGSCHPTDSWEPRSICVDGIREHDKAEIYPFRKDVFRGTALENAKFKEYIKGSRGRCYPVTYLRTFQKHQQAENLVVQGAAELLNQLIYANKSYSGYGYTAIERIVVPEKGICWKRKKPAQMLDLNKDEWRYFKAHPWDLDVLEAYKKIRAAGYSVDAFRYKEGELPISMDDAVTLATKYGTDPEKAVRYLDRQNRKIAPPEECDGIMLLDYWSMAKQEGVRFLTERDRWPKDLYHAHELMVDLMNRRQREEERRREAQRLAREKKDAEDKRGDFERLAQLWGPLSFSADGLSIRIASAPQELFEEGMWLHHCVGSYVNKHAQGGCCIFFLRRAEAPDEPYYTLELNMQTFNVIQNRGKRNCERTPEIEAFETQWLAYIQQFKGLQNGQKERKSA